MSNVTNLNSSTSTPLQAWVEKLLTYMLACYGKRFTDQWVMVQHHDLVDVWAQELEGLTHAELKAGKEALATRDWPPTLPEFKKLCRPAVDAIKAYYEAVAGVQARANGEMGEWSHPAIYWATVPLGVELREQSYSQVKARWESSLEQQLAKGAWEPIPKPYVKLAAPGKSTTSTEKAREAIKQAADQVLHGFASTEWARKLLERHKAGEKLTPTQILFARQALGQA